jgi:hypothetical protein
MVDNQIWRDKDIRIARQSAIKSSVGLLDIAERMGLLTNVDSFQELLDANDTLVDRIFDKIYAGMQ